MSTPSLSRPAAIASWIAQILATAILLQTLFFKFTGAPESVYIFETVGLEPFGRYGSGVAELIAAILLLIPALAPFGALLAAGVMVGAIGSHLFTPLGIALPVFDAQTGAPTAETDGGFLFALACIVLASSLLVLFLRRARLLKLLPGGARAHAA